MIINSDWHIHSECSYDATLELDAIAEAAKSQGLFGIGITDHANFNDEKFMGDLRASADKVKALQSRYPFVTLGVELTPIEKPEFDYIAKTGSREGYVAPSFCEPFALELAATREELMSLGVRYAVGAAHWRVDVPGARYLPDEIGASVREWYRQQMWLACDERVTILGHPWYHGKGLWYEDFSVIPHSMNMDIAAAALENGKYVECNSQFFYSKKSTERFRHQYAEFLRELFEMGIPLTYGSDSHHSYDDLRGGIEKYLMEAGFREGDFSTLSDKDFYR